MELTDGVGVDATLECVGTGQAMDTALAIARPGSMVGYVGVPHGVELPVSEMFFRNKGLRGGSAPVRAYIPELLDDVLEGRINPGRVLDFETDLDGIAEAYAAMDERRAIKSLVRVGRPERCSTGRTRTRPGSARARRRVNSPLDDATCARSARFVSDATSSRGRRTTWYVRSRRPGRSWSSASHRPDAGRPRRSRARSFAGDTVVRAWEIDPATARTSRPLRPALRQQVVDEGAPRDAGANTTPT